MKPLRRHKGNQHLHRASLEYRNAVKRKLHAYHVFIQAGIICQGLLQYLAVAFPQLVWNSFSSWLRTIRPGIPPSELVVANALRQSLPEFLLNTAPSNIFAKFLIERQDTDKMAPSVWPPEPKFRPNPGLSRRTTSIPTNRRHCTRLSLRRKPADSSSGSSGTTRPSRAAG
jgi:hypothetical protein